MLKKISWFLGEFFVVVAGVLVAFGLNGWYQGIREQDKERLYLKEIHADLLTTAENVEEAEETQRKTVHAAAQLLKASYSSMLPTDSVLAVYAFQSMSFAPATQVSAALSSLVSTGDLQLISNDSLRAELGGLVSLLEEYTLTNNEMGYSWLFQAYENFADVVHAADLRMQVMGPAAMAVAAKDSLSGLPHPAEAEWPEAVNLAELVRTPEFRKTLLKLYVAHANLYRAHTGFHEELEEVLRVLEKEMEVRNIERPKRSSKRNAASSNGADR